MAITHWNPLSEFVSLRSAMDQLFNDSLVRANGAPSLSSGTPAYDLYETEQGLTFRFAVPGVVPEDVEVTVQQDTLTVNGRYPEVEQAEGQSWHVRGLPQSGTFTYRFKLPTAINADQTDARFENGILTLMLPKAEAAKPKRIAISAPAASTASATPVNKGVAAE